MTGGKQPQEPELPTTARLQREYRTIQNMLRIACRARHGRTVGCEGLCPECRELLAYAGKRLANCPYGEAKPTCAKCPVHCYGRARREQVHAVMRYAGPRMLWRHPWQALLHVLDRLRRAEAPRKPGQRRTGQDESAPN